MIRRALIPMILAASMALPGAACFNDSDSGMDPIWGPQCPPGYVDSCNDDGTNCSCKRE